MDVDHMAQGFRASFFPWRCFVKVSLEGRKRGLSVFYPKTLVELQEYGQTNWGWSQTIGGGSKIEPYIFDLLDSAFERENRVEVQVGRSYDSVYIDFSECTEYLTKKMDLEIEMIQAD